MEKLVIISDSSGWFSSVKASEVNKYLEQGWTVKSITTVTQKDGVAAFFILEKN